MKVICEFCGQTSDSLRLFNYYSGVSEPLQPNKEKRISDMYLCSDCLNYLSGAERTIGSSDDLQR